MRYRIFMLAALAAITQSCANRQDEHQLPPANTTVMTQEQPGDAGDMQSLNTIEDRDAYANYDMDEPADNRVKAERNRSRIIRNTLARNRRVGRIDNDNATVRGQSTQQRADLPIRADVVYVMPNSTNGNQRIKTAYEVPRNVYIKERRNIASNIPATPTVPPGNADVDHYDKPGADYRGEDAMTHDGVAKNIERNLNYLDFSNAKPRNDGGEFDR